MTSSAYAPFFSVWAYTILLEFGDIGAGNDDKNIEDNNKSVHIVNDAHRRCAPTRCIIGLALYQPLIKSFWY